MTILIGTDAYSPFRLDALREAIAKLAPDLGPVSIDAKWVYAIQPQGDEVDAAETPIGYVPKPGDINLEGIDVTPEVLADLVSVDKEIWKGEAARIEEFYAKFGDKLPQSLRDELDALEKRL